jgi:hypothetical protein
MAMKTWICQLVAAAFLPQLAASWRTIAYYPEQVQLRVDKQ